MMKIPQKILDIFLTEVLSANKQLLVLDIHSAKYPCTYVKTRRKYPMGAYLKLPFQEQKLTPFLMSTSNGKIIRSTTLAVGIAYVVPCIRMKPIIITYRILNH